VSRRAAQRPRQRERIDERVPLAHVPVQVRQRRDPGQLPVVGLGAHVGDQGEPEPQLGEPHRGEAQIHSEQRMRHHVAPHRAGRRFARRAPQPGQLLERAEQECARAHRRIEHGEASQVGRPLRRLAAMDPTLRGGRGEAEPVHEHGLEPGTHDLPHQRGRRVIAAAGTPLGGIHHSFEHPAQHVGRDRVAVFGLARREVKPLEQVVERVAPVAVAPARGAVAPLQGRGLEQAAVQKRQAAERPGRAGAVGGRAVERPETQRVEHPAVKRTPGRDAVVEPADQVATVPVQPPLGLDEVEEQHPRERGQREGVTLGPAARCRQPIGQALERGAERAEETWCDGLARERFAHAQAQRQGRLAWPRAEALQRLERAPGGPFQRDGGDADDGPACRGAPARAQQPPRRGAQCAREAPLGVRREPLRRRPHRALGIARLEREHAERIVARHQRRAYDAGGLRRSGAEPGPGRHVLPGRLKPERPKEVAKIVDLLGTAEKLPQHHGTPGSDATTLRQVLPQVGTRELRRRSKTRGHERPGMRPVKRPGKGKAMSGCRAHRTDDGPISRIPRLGA